MSATQSSARPFSVLLREYRVAAGISQEELAERARLSGKTIGALERGERQSPYRDTVDLLATALRLSPGERRELEAAAQRRRTRRVETGSLRGTAHRPVDLGAVRDSLPLEPTRLVGRDKALGAIAGFLVTARLVTLVGPGGIGKTRLAVAAARNASGRFADGARLVELAAVESGDTDAVAAAIGGAVGIAADGAAGPREALVAGLRARRLLLVLDNCEHLLQQSARVVADVLAGCAGVTVLATSREPLRARGEHIWQVPALSLPADGSPAALAASDAAALFRERALAVRPGFEVRGGDAEALASICRRLDGLPLALELAAARVGMLSLREIARALDDRFGLLVGGERTAAPRHQALHTTIAWSYDLLGPAEQRLFRRAAVFADGFTLDALVEVCSAADLTETAIFAGVMTLVDKSLVVAEIGAERTRYRMLESTHAFAREMLAGAGERDTLGRRHAAFMLAFVRGLRWEMWESPDPETVAELVPEIENLRTALRFCLDDGGEGALGAQLAVESANIFRRLDRRVESERRLEALLAAGAHEPAVEAGAAYNLLYSMYAAPEGQVAAGRRAVALLDELELPARAAHASALLAQVLAVCFGRYDEAQPLIERALRFARASGDRALLDQVLRLASQALPPTAHAERRRAGAESIALARASGVDRRIADALSTAAEVEFAAGGFDAALRLGRDALAAQRRIPNRTGLALVLTNVAAYALAAGELDYAAACAREAVPLAREVESRLALLLALQHLAGVAIARDPADAERAAFVLGYVDAQFERAGFVRETTEQLGYERDLAAIRAALGAPRAAEALEIGALLSDERAIEAAVR